MEYKSSVHFDFKEVNFVRALRTNFRENHGVLKHIELRFSRRRQVFPTESINAFIYSNLAMSQRPTWKQSPSVGKIRDRPCLSQYFDCLFARLAGADNFYWKFASGELLGNQAASCIIIFPFPVLEK